MTGAGWFMMVASWTAIGTLTFFCMRKVIRLTIDQAQHIHPIYEIDTHDQEKK